MTVTTSNGFTVVEAGSGQTAVRLVYQNPADAALEAFRRTGESRVILSGGCFANRLLTSLFRSALMKRGMEVFVPSIVLIRFVFIFFLFVYGHSTKEIKICCFYLPFICWIIGMIR